MAPQVSDCQPFGSVGEGGLCSHQIDCSAGRFCMTVNDALGTHFECHQVCNLAASGECSGGESCVTVPNAISPRFGICFK